MLQPFLFYSKYTMILLRLVLIEKIHPVKLLRKDLNELNLNKAKILINYINKLSLEIDSNLI